MRILLFLLLALSVSANNLELTHENNKLQSKIDSAVIELYIMYNDYSILDYENFKRKETNLKRIIETNNKKMEVINKKIEVRNKYIERLPHKDIQLKYIKKYNIPIVLAIFINYIESDFQDLIHNGNLNKTGHKDWGSLQINDKYNPIVITYINEKDFHGYYDLGYKFMLSKKSKNFYKWFTNWNNTKPHIAKQYYNALLHKINNQNEKDLKYLL